MSRKMKLVGFRLLSQGCLLSTTGNSCLTFQPEWDTSDPHAAVPCNVARDNAQQERDSIVNGFKTAELADYAAKHDRYMADVKALGKAQAELADLDAVLADAALSGDTSVLASAEAMAEATRGKIRSLAERLRVMHPAVNEARAAVQEKYRNLEACTRQRSNAMQRVEQLKEKLAKTITPVLMELLEATAVLKVANGSFPTIDHLIPKAPAPPAEQSAPIADGPRKINSTRSTIFSGQL